jgi:hypothetical protein
MSPLRTKNFLPAASICPADNVVPDEKTSKHTARTAYPHGPRRSRYAVMRYAWGVVTVFGTVMTIQALVTAGVLPMRP